MDSIGYGLHRGILATDIIPGSNNVAMVGAAYFHAVPLYDRVSPDLYLTIGPDITGTYFCSFSQCHNYLLLRLVFDRFQQT
jgi:hypothetical protein